MCPSSIGFAAEPDCIAAFRATLLAVRRRIRAVTGALASVGEAFDVMLEHALVAWGADTKVRRAHRIMERDGWLCGVPGRSSRKNLHVHHLVPRSRGGGDAEANLVTLCAWHHLRGVHGGILVIQGKAPDELVFALPLGTWHSGDRLVQER